LFSDLKNLKEITQKILKVVLKIDERSKASVINIEKVNKNKK